MSEFIFNKQKYLDRINFKGEIMTSIECFTALHQAQHRNIPFENFDLCLGQQINLEPAVLFQKLVQHKRGGYCFELNGLFLMALQAFGFEARALLGRVHITGEPTGKGHQISLLTLNGKKWILDTGFGSNTPIIPIPLTYDEYASYQHQTYRIIDHDLFGNMLQIRQKDGWKDLYSFELTPVFPGDIEYGNYFTSTSPKSFFTFSRVAALPMENGMMSLYNYTFKKVINGKEEIITLETGPSYLDFIARSFGIELDAEYKDLKPIHSTSNTSN